tara:strand:+ start:125 stop:889 length:765 start_codon:yes stop_codon:yes gene_type:complete
MDINNKVAIITGAGSGIGRAVSLALLHENVNTFLIGRTLRTLQETKKLSRKKNYRGKAIVCKCDVSREDNVKKIFQEAFKSYGRIDLLFNNAGIGSKPSSIDKISYKDWRKVIDININGMFLCAKYAYALMKRQKPKGGRIINNGSIAAFSPRPGTAPYTTSKHAISGLTKSISLDGRKDNVVCSQIDIGNAETKLTKGFKKGVVQASGIKVSEPVMDVNDVAKTIVHIFRLPLDTNILSTTIMANSMPFIGRG